MSDQKSADCRNVIKVKDELYTKSLTPGISVYGEQLVKMDGVEYRGWDPKRSKLAAYILLSGDCVPLRTEDIVLYLGAASGTTVSHVSDIVDGGQIYAVEISKRSFRDLMRNCGPRVNTVPVLGDARNRNLLAGMITHADFLYVDVAQRDQADIFLSNFEHYGCRRGILMLKCRSIDVAADPARIAKETVERMRSTGLRCDEPVNLDRFEKDHYAILADRGGP